MSIDLRVVRVTAQSDKPMKDGDQNWWAILRFHCEDDSHHDVHVHRTRKRDIAALIANPNELAGGNRRTEYIRLNTAGQMIGRRSSFYIGT